MENMIGTLKAVSQSFGLLFEEDDKWQNVDKEYQKTLSVDDIILMKGSKVQLIFNEKGYYTSIVNLDTVGEVVGKPVEKTYKKAYSGIKQDTTKPMKASISKEYIMKIQGKEFITHAGLLKMGHELGIKSINTILISNPLDETSIVKATVTLKDSRSFSGLGDANKDNVNSMILPHKIRMAETRAINRALRFATNTGLCSVDELKDFKSVVKEDE